MENEYLRLSDYRAAIAEKTKLLNHFIGQPRYDFTEAADFLDSIKEVKGGAR